MKIVFEIHTAVDQQTRTNDKTFKGVPDPNRPPVQPRPYLVYFGPIMQYHCNMPKTQILDALLVAIGLLNSYNYMNFHLDWTKMVELWAN